MIDAMTESELLDSDSQAETPGDRVSVTLLRDGTRKRYPTHCRELPCLENLFSRPAIHAVADISW